MLTIPGVSVQTQIYESANSLVYRGIRQSDNQPIILKILKENYPTPQELARYRTEYQITKSLNISGVVKVYDLQKYQNTLVMSLEDFGGESLKILMQQRSFSLAEFLSIAIKVTEILGQIHASNIIHKDINPSNIIFHASTGQVKIIDFGISTQLSRENTILKNPNVLEGTLAYISPEQTGRMNRPLDYRTDFYSLGITFYELLTNQLPFTTNDALELVHCHIAKSPLPPAEINPKIPQVISEIIMKLMAKNAEERYQSALGIQRDLEECLKKLDTNNKITQFPLGRQDISDKFQIPQKLYGREKEIETLLTAFDRVTSSASELMLIAGYSGIGKSALVQELYKPITEKRGYFISGKFDQYQRNIPYSAVVSAFQELIKQLLTESETQVNQWREKLLAAVGSNGQVIVEVIPEIELIIGEQPALPELGLNEAQHLFNLVFQKFIKVFTQAEHPLALFLDDLQWADGASLKLIRLLINSASPGLFLIGAYRDNEVSAVHPLMLTLDEIGKNGGNINRISLSPLDLTTVLQLLSETIKTTEERLNSLGNLILLKTGGNPFFLNEFLKSLYTENLLYFDFIKVEWQWDLEKINARGFTDNVVELMGEKIQKLSVSTQNLLKIAACIGNQFDLKTLGLVSEKSIIETVQELHTAVADNLVVTVGTIRDVELVIASTQFNLNELGTSHHRLPEYKFVHDRIQQAAYSLIPEQEKALTHYQIGQLLLQQISSTEVEDKIFAVVNQLNYGITLIEDQKERDQIAKLNLIACRKARASTAYQAAREYASIGLNLLGSEAWRRQYEITLKLNELGAEVALLTGQFDQMNQWIDAVIAHAKTPLEKAGVYLVRIQAVSSQNKLLDAIAIGQEILQELGIKFPDDPTEEDIHQAVRENNALIGDRAIEELFQLPAMVDAEKLAIMQIAGRILPACYISGSILYSLVVALLVKLSLQYGNSPNSPYSYAGYGLFLINFLQDVISAGEFGRLGCRLASAVEAKYIRAATFELVGVFLHHRQSHLRETIPMLEMGYQAGLETGNLEYVGFNGHGFCLGSYWCGQALAEIEPQIRAYRQQLLDFNLITTANYCSIFWETILFLQGNPDEKQLLFEEKPDGESLVSQLIASNDLRGIFYFYLHRAILRFLMGEIAEANADVVKARPYLVGGAGSTCEGGLYFYDSLIALAIIPNSPTELETQQQRVQENQIKLQHWAQHCHENYLHKWQLVEAEKYRVLGQKADAIELYDQAIAGAKANDYIQEEALANELAAKFYLNWGKENIAQVYMQVAYYCYELWGAITKVKYLEKLYPQLLATTQTAIKDTKITTVATTSGSSAQLDIATVMKATTTISGEIVLDKLLSSLMKILIENAGAQIGYLILNSQGKLLIEAAGTINSEQITVLKSLPIETYQEIPQSLINYVARTQQNVVLNDAAKEGMFTNDPYIKQHQPKSILCVPLINQGKLVSIVYLENNLTVGAFTPQRLEVLKILSSQAAISLENSHLYTQLEEYNLTLEQKVEERTLELANANQEIRVLNERLKAENMRMSAELDVTRKLQQMILPKEEELSQIEGLEIAGFMEPADEVGGDYYDVLQQDGKVKIGIGDVTGHGLESGMLMIMAQTAVRTLLASNETNPAKFLDILNRTLYQNVKRMNCEKSMTLALLDYSQGSVTISGQHEEVLVVRAEGKVELIDTIDLGFPIGLELEITDFISHIEVQLNSGDGVVLYTDGITEAPNMKNQEYGLERLCQVIRDSWHKSAGQIRQNVIDDVRRHIGEQKVYDDITLVILKQQ
jgi:predicted ATPase/serine phosphatase RsbU (regulator of sigma subunit)/tRNA A-37 threonylcarbamoyl transferase component Bud32